HWLGAEDVATLLDEPARRFAVLDVLDHPRVGAVSVTLARMLHNSLERAAARAYPLDRGDLLHQGEDRLDLERGAEPGLSGADAPPLAQVLERVDHEPHL